MKASPVVLFVLLLLIVSVSGLVACGVSTASASYTAGAWNNFDYDRPASYWASAVRECGGSGGVLDLVVAQAQNGYAALPFPYRGTGGIRGVSDGDLAEPYLDAFDREGLSVILSVQPSNADVKDLIRIILDRYGHHRCIIGVNVDLEWKKSGTPLHADNGERDAWTAEISRSGPGRKLFLTYFGDYTYFPDDDGKMVVMYDGLGDTQENILSAYRELAKHFANVGIYTGYRSSRPQAAPDEMILAAAPNTRYIIHTDDVKTSAKAAIRQTPVSRPAGSGRGDDFMSGFPSNGFSMPTISAGTGGFPSFFKPAESDSAPGTGCQANASAGSQGFMKNFRLRDIGGILSQIFNR